MNENWKSVIGYEGLYEVSNLGNVRSLNYLGHGRTQVLKPGTDGGGYQIVILYKNNKAKTFKVHRLVAEAFISNPENFKEIDHINTIKNDNRVENLRWTDRSGNLRNPLTMNRLINNPKMSKPVLQYDMNGNLIKEYPSAREVERVLGYSQGNISMCCNGKFKSRYGFIWRYKK